MKPIKPGTKANLTERALTVKVSGAPKGLVKTEPMSELMASERPISVSDLDVDDFGRKDVGGASVYRGWPMPMGPTVESARPARETFVFDRADGKVKPKEEPKLPVVAGAEGAIVWASGEWVATKPTDDHTQEFPFLSSFARAGVVPEKLQKQPADRGTFFAPAIHSAALGKTTRFGLYLPPGFDPASDTKYPVLTLLPGRGGELNQWTSVGGIVPMLNSAMSGDHQKMIVVIADNTNSFWFDYDKNGTPTHAAKDKEFRPRNYEGHVEELLGEVLREYKGDPDKLGIGGISRGGAGALQLASRHPGKFVSASSQSGLLAFDHGDNRLSGLAQELKSHFGEADDPVWSNFTPYDLLKNGKLDRDTQLYVEVGADDADMLPGNLDYIALAKQRGQPIEHAVWGERAVKEAKKKDGKGKQKKGADKDIEKPSNVAHNWDLWAKTLPHTIAFHQRAQGGKAFKPKVEASFHLRDGELLRQREASLKERSTEVVAELAGLKSDLPLLTEHLSNLVLPLPRPFEPSMLGTLRALKENPRWVTQDLGQRIAEVEKLLPDLPLFAQEERVTEVRALAEAIWSTDELESHLLGTPMPRLSTKGVGINALPKAVRDDLKALIDLVPEAKDALAQFANQSPEVLSRVDSELTTHDGTFANHLLKFAKTVMRKDERAGFVEFIEKMAHGEWDWRREGFSHTVNSATSIAFRHPGIVLDLISSAREGAVMEYGHVYPGDGGSAALGYGDNSRGDFKAGFRPVEADFEGLSLPPAKLGYERGFLRLVKNQLAPEKLSADRFGVTCGPIAVAMSKLLNKDVRYGYLHKIKTGAHLAEAMESQGEYGLSLAEAWVQVGDDPNVTHLHFPHFSDFDPVTRTVVMQEWSRGRQRINVDQLKFITDKGAQPVSGYFLTGKGHEGIEKFWTRDAEPKPKPPPPPDPPRYAAPRYGGSDSYSYRSSRPSDDFG